MKKLLCSALALLATAALASCGGTPTEEFKPALDTQTTYVIHVAGEYSNFNALDDTETRFQQYYPNVEIEYQKVDNYEKMIATRLVGNDKPDIFFSYPKYVDEEAYAPIASQMEDLSDPALKLDFSYARSSLLKRDGQGKIFMAPVFSRTYGMLVNEGLFKKEGIQIPTTLAEFTSACESFLAKGYKSPLMGFTKPDKNGNPTNGLMYAVAYPFVVAELAKHPEAVELANKLDPRAGEYTRVALTKVKSLFDNGCVNLEECDKIGDNYEKTLLRFFEGDVPMMACDASTVSGAKSREIKSDAFKAKPFTYTFNPIPLAEEGGYFVDSPSLEFSVNKNSDNLAMTNEFMRFLLRTAELDNLTSRKGLITATKTTPFPKVYYKDKEGVETYTSFYHPFNDVPASRTFASETVGIKDALTGQVKAASFYVGRGDLTVDEAVAKYGTFA